MYSVNSCFRRRHLESKKEELLPKVKHYDAIFLCTPNNPTGVVYDRQSIIELVEEGYRSECSIIIDEAFYDFTVDSENVYFFSKAIS